MTDTIVKFYLARADRNGESVQDDKLESIKVKLAKITGGFSQYDIKGYWINENQILIKESTQILESFTDQSKIEEIQALAADYKESCNQESVLITINGAPVFS